MTSIDVINEALTKLEGHIKAWKDSADQTFEELKNRKRMPFPRTGISVVIRRGDLYLLGERKGSHAAGTWNFPGGHLEYGEYPEECAAREVLEETGLVVDNTKIKFSGVISNDIFMSERKHYTTIYMLAEDPGGQADLKEPSKCGEWKWLPIMTDSFAKDAEYKLFPGMYKFVDEWKSKNDSISKPALVKPRLVPPPR